VKPRQRLLVMILLYVGLDLCLPGMPGAFVFDAAGSVESVEPTRARPTPRAAVLSPIPIRGPDTLLTRAPSDVIHRRPPSSALARPGRRIVVCLARAACARPLPPEDSH